MARRERTAPERGPVAAPTVCQEQIALRAYEKWRARVGACDRELLDWLEAEAELSTVAGLARRLADCRGRLARLVARHGQAERRLVAEHAISRILSGSETLLAAVPNLIRAICDGLDWGAGAVWLVDPDARLLRCVEAWQPEGESPAFERLSRQMTFAPGDGLPGRAWATGQPAWSPDVGGQPQCPRDRVAAEAGLRGAVAIPIQNGAGALGALELYGREAGRPDARLARMLTCIASQICLFIEYREAEGRLLARAHDRRIGREIQQGLLPGGSPRCPGFQIAGRSRAADEVGGDCFDFVEMTARGNDRLCVFVADASGHGIGAALLTGQTRAYLRALSLAYSDLGILLTLTNQRLAADAASDHFVTGLFVSLDPLARSLAYASAGHVPGHVLDARGEIKATLNSTGLPLGIAAGDVFCESPPLLLDPGDLVLLLTDGVVEAASPSGAKFGMERALGLVRRHRQEAPAAILTALLDAVCGFCDHRLHDDMTAVVIQCVSAA
jgi:serine phosphatase RsbU (regulator of sigma subunit)